MTPTIAIVSTSLVTLWCCLQIGQLTAQQSVPTSPCPNVLRFEPRTGGPNQDRWYGVVTLQSEAELSGVWLRLYFDKPSLQLGNWFGDVPIVPRDNNQFYMIRNPQYILKANVPKQIRFFIRYDSNQDSEPPEITRLALNGKTICEDSSKIQTTTPYLGEPITSAELATLTTHRPSTTTTITQRPKRPVGGLFQGDFNFFRKQQRPFLDVHCGSIVLAPRPLITNGQVTQQGEFPWHVALYLDSDSQTNQTSHDNYICGGSLVSRSHVITAAHCVTVQGSNVAASGQSFRVYFGKFYLNDWANPGIQSRQPKDIIPHPQYDAENFSNDIAVLKMATPVDITDYVRPVCLWSGSKPDLLEERTGVVVGWGYNEHGNKSEELRKAEMPVVSEVTCIRSLSDFFNTFTNNQTFCAGFRNGTSVCSGDSGGGMVFPRDKTTGSNDNNNGGTVWELRGVVSLSVAVQSEIIPKCDTSHYAVFTDVAKFSDWIKENMT